jgi:Protein of unknown function (DUF1631)
MSVNADQVFQECVKDALSQAHLLINQVVNTVMDTFETRAIDAITNKERQRYHDLLIELRRSKATLSRSFIAQFSSLVETSGQPNGKPKQALEYGDINLDNITLMDDSSMQEDVEVSQLIQLIESKAEWEIRDLNSRMSALKGTGVLDPSHNPMRPELFGRSLQRAVQSVPLADEERLVLLRSFGAALSTALKDTYASYSKKLQARNVKPMQYGVRTTRVLPSASAAYAAAAANQAAELAQYTPLANGGAALPAQGGGSNAYLQGYSADQIERLMRGGQGQGAFAPRQPSEGLTLDAGPSSFFGGGSNEALRGLLHKVVLANAVQTQDTASTNLITQFREDLFGAANRPIERLTIDVVAMMFDHILADARLLLPVKAALSRLQIPVLRMALADATLFSSRQHPTRKFINRVASYSAGYTSESDPQFALFMGSVNTEVEKLASDETEEAQLYTQSLENIELVITQINQDSARASDEAVKVLERAELRTVMRSSISHHLATALSTVEVDEYLRDFIRNQWALVLVECIMQHGEEAEETKLCKQTASDLIWSVQPKSTSHDRQNLLKMLPGLVKQIRDGLASVEWGDYSSADQLKFFSQLMASHARAVKADASAKAAAKPDATAAAWLEKVAQAWGGTLELDSPEQLGDVMMAAVEKDATFLIDTADVQSVPAYYTAAIEPSAPIVSASIINAANTDAANTSEPQSLVKEDLPPQVIDEPDSVLKPASILNPDSGNGLDYSSSIPSHLNNSALSLKVEYLEVGTWYEMKLHGKWSRVQLFWKSPKNLFFMFSSNVGGKAHSITRRALDKLCTENNLRSVESEGLIDRAVAGVMASANSPKQ